MGERFPFAKAWDLAQGLRIMTSKVSWKRLSWQNAAYVARDHGDIPKMILGGSLSSGGPNVYHTSRTSLGPSKKSRRWSGKFEMAPWFEAFFQWESEISLRWCDLERPDLRGCVGRVLSKGSRHSSLSSTSGFARWHSRMRKGKSSLWKRPGPN